MALLALWPLAAKPDAGVRDAIAFAGIGVLFAYGTWVRIAERVRTGRPSEEARARAWHRAREIDGDDASLGLLVAGWVPVGLLLATGLLLWPHMTDPDPATAVAWVVMALPPVALGWLMATSAWLDACRDDLARAEHEADARLRRYWAGVGR
jgi:hypothetical protein